MKNNLIEYLNESATKFPEKICVVDNSRSISFSRLYAEAYQIAKILVSHKITKMPILVYLPKETSAIVSFASILMSNNFYAPVDIKSPKSRIKLIIDNLRPGKVITKRKYEKEMQKLSVKANSILFIDDIINNENLEFSEKLIGKTKKMTQKSVDTDPCYVMHTSGSTGVPKGVVIPHRGVEDYIEWAISCFKITDNEIIGNQAPLYFDNSTLDLYLSWATGATLHLIPEEKFIFPVKLIEYLEKNEINFIFFVPTVLINISKLKLLKNHRLPKLQKVLFAGEVMPTKHLAYWQDHLQNRLFANLYGPTEITVDCTYYIIHRKYHANESLPIGFPCYNSDIIILNEKNKQASIKEVGELCVRGSSLALGYWNNTDKTQEVFTQNPLHNNYIDLIYRTGDLVFKNERKEIIYVGRKDFQIKHLGHRIELYEIEHASLLIPEIENSCTLYNSKKSEIVLFYEGKDELEQKYINTELSRLIPRYMMPKRIYYLKKMPLNQNGKIDRKLLEANYIKKNED